MIQARLNLRVVVINLHPILRKRVADFLQIRMREFLVMLLVHEADDVVQDENAFDRVAHRLVLGLEPVNDQVRAHGRAACAPTPAFPRGQS